MRIQMGQKFEHLYSKDKFERLTKSGANTNMNQASQMSSNIPATTTIMNNMNCSQQRNGLKPLNSQIIHTQNPFSQQHPLPIQQHSLYSQHNTPPIQPRHTQLIQPQHIPSIPQQQSHSQKSQNPYPPPNRNLQNPHQQTNTYEFHNRIPSHVPNNQNPRPNTYQNEQIINRQNSNNIPKTNEFPTTTTPTYNNSINTDHDLYSKYEQQTKMQKLSETYLQLQQVYYEAMHKKKLEEEEKERKEEEIFRDVGQLNEQFYFSSEELQLYRQKNYREQDYEKKFVIVVSNKPVIKNNNTGLLISHRQSINNHHKLTHKQIQISQNNKEESISKFPEPINCYYTAELTYEQEPQTKHSYAGQISIFQKCSQKMKIEALTIDLHNTHKLKLKTPDIQLQSYSICFTNNTWYHNAINKFTKLVRGKEQFKSEMKLKFNFQIRDRKINLPVGYQVVYPREFGGFVVDLNQLEIRNRYGRIKWKCSALGRYVCVRDVDFSQGIHIGQSEVIIDKPELQNASILVQFNKFPKFIQKLLSTQKKGIEGKVVKILKKSVERDGNKLLSCDIHSQKWEIEVPPSQN